PADPRQTLHKAAIAGRLPKMLDLGDPARHEQQVEALLADDLVGDARLAAARIARHRRHQTDSSSARNGLAGSTVAPAACTRAARKLSEVTTRTAPGSASASRRRTISSSAESRRGRGACATSITVDEIGGNGGLSKTTVTSSR